MSIPELKQADNGVWYVHWTDRRRSKRVSTRTRDMAAAKAFLGQWLLMEHEAPASVAAGFTIADLWAVYDKKHIEHNVTSPMTMRNAWKRLEPHFGTMMPAAINQDVVDAYIKARTTGRIGLRAQSSTIRRELVALRAYMNWSAAPKRKIIQPAHLPAFDLPSDSPPRDRWLRTDEIQRLLNAAASMRGKAERMPRGERFLWLALETAGRKTAILELTWDRVDFETGVIHLAVPGRKVTKNRRASVPVSKALRPVLERMHRERINTFVMDNQSDVWATVQCIAERAGFGDPCKTPRWNGMKPRKTGISPHVLRHTAATQMARRGVPLYDIAGVLGNSLAMVEKVYAKHCPERLRAAVDRISGDSLNAAE